MTTYCESQKNYVHHEIRKHQSYRKSLAAGSGYREIAEYITQCGPVIAVGIKGTGSYAAELTRVPTAGGFTVKEVNRPNLQFQVLVLFCAAGAARPFQTW